MSFSIDWWLLVSGLGLFMLGMFFLERSLKSLLNRAVIQSLRTATASLWLAVPLGVVPVSYTHLTLPTILRV